MNKLKLALLLGAVAQGGCSTANYYYSFDLSDPGARNITKPGERAALEDSDVKSEILVDATSFKAILLDLTNKTDQPLGVQWDQIVMTGPDQVARPLRPDTSLNAVDAGRKVVARLVPFQLPSQGGAAANLDQAHFELDVPLTIRGAPKMYRYHFVATAHKL